MKSTYIFIIILIFSACSVNKQVIMTGIDRQKYPGDPKLQVVERFYDNLSEKKMTKVLLDYYSSLVPKSFKSLELRVDTTITNLDFYPAIAISFSKRAKDGYLEINKYINDSVQTKIPIDYLIDSDTVNNTKMIEKLLSLKSNKIKSYILLNDRYMKIETK